MRNANSLQARRQVHDQPCPSFTWQLKKAGRRMAQELKEQEVLKKRFQEIKEAEA